MLREGLDHNDEDEMHRESVAGAGVRHTECRCRF